MQMLFTEQKNSAIAADSDNSNSPSVLKNPRVLKLWRFGAHEFYSITWMLLAHKLKNFDVFPSYNLKFDWRVTLPVVEFGSKMLYSSQNFLLHDWPTLV